MKIALELQYYIVYLLIFKTYPNYQDNNQRFHALSHIRLDKRREVMLQANKLAQPIGVNGGSTSK